MQHLPQNTKQFIKRYYSMHMIPHRTNFLHHAQSFCATAKIQEISTQPDHPKLPRKRQKKPKRLFPQQKFFDFLIESSQIDINSQPKSQTQLPTPDDQIEDEPSNNNQPSIITNDIDILSNPLAPIVNCPHNSRFARVSIIGMPNVGKSSLLNRIINHPVSAVSSKVNTTREQTVGCLTKDNIQIEFIDTPGILPLSLFHPQRDAKQHNLHYEAWTSVYKSDIIIMMVDPTNRSQSKNILIAEQLATLKNPENDGVDIDKLVLVINKCDLFWPHTKLYDLAKSLNDKCKFDITLIISAKHWRRIDKLKGYLLTHIGSMVNQKSTERYSRKWKFDSYMKTTMSRDDEILECIRAKIYQRTHQEVPYKVELEMERDVVEEDGKMFVDVVMNVKSRSHQNMLNGSAGQHIKRWAARDLTTRFGKDVIVKLRARMN